MSHWGWWWGPGVIGAGSLLVACFTGGSGGHEGAPTFDAGFTGDAASAPDGGTSGDSGAGPQDSGGSSVDASGDSGAPSACGNTPDAAGLPYTGIVELSRVTAPPAATVYEALGEFDTTASAPPSMGTCTGGMLVGACCYQPSSGGTLPTPESAGTLTIKDGANTLATLTSPNYVATSATLPALTWAAGSTLSVATTGGTLDAFTANVRAPAVLAGLSPSFQATIAVTLSSDFVVSWTPSNEACSKISFGFSQGAQMPYVGCVVDDSVGTVTVPKALLGMFTATTGTAVLERVEGKELVTANSGIKYVVLDVIQAKTTYSP
jgi:hypothetical protein